MSLLSYGALVCFLAGTTIAVLSLYFNPKAELNQIVALIGIGYAISSLAYVWIYGAQDKNLVWTFFRISTIGTSFLIPVATFWSDLVFAQTRLRTRVLLSIPFSIFYFYVFIYGLNHVVAFVDFVPSPLGNVGILAKNLPVIAAGVVVLVLQTAIALIFLLRRRATTPLKRIRRQITVLLIFWAISVVVSETELTLVRTYQLPNLDIFYGLLRSGFLFFVIIRFRFLRSDGATLENEIIRAMKEGVVLLEPDLRIRKINPVTRAIVDRDESDLISKDFASLFDQPEVIRQEWAAVVKSARTTEILGVTVNGKDVELVLAPSFDRFGDVVGGLALLRKNEIFAEALARYGITARERDVVLMLARGFNRKEIAESQFIAPNTVKNHIHNIYEKTGAANRVELLLMLLDDKMNRSVYGKAMNP